MNKDPIKDPICTDPEIAASFREASDSMGPKCAHGGIRLFKEKYSRMASEDLSWTEICRDAAVFGCWKFAFFFTISILDRGIYHGDFQDDLYRQLPVFKKLPNPA